MKKKLILLLFVLSCTPSFAATMCVPDYGLSTCDSCKNFKEIAYTSSWYASCCGVDVYGVYLPMKADFGITRSVSANEFDGSFFTPAGSMHRNFCLMLSPVIAPYMVQVSYDFDWSVSACNTFIPRCAMTYCDGVVEPSGENPFE